MPRATNIGIDLNNFDAFGNRRTRPPCTAPAEAPRPKAEPVKPLPVLEERMLADPIWSGARPPAEKPKIKRRRRFPRLAYNGD